MAVDAGNLKTYCRGVDLSTALQSTALDQTREEADDTVFASTIRSMKSTLQRVALAHSGLYEDGPFSLAEVFRQANVTDEEPVTICPVGPVVGERAFIVVAHKASLTLPESVAPGQLYRASMRASGRAPVPGNGVVGYFGAVSGDSQHAGVQLGAPAAGQQILATIHLVAIAPVPSVVFFLESDNGVGFGSPVIQDTSAAQVARGSVLLRKSGPITDDWWRVRWDHSGTGSFTALIALGLAG